jgi:hypothetical protein
MVLIGRVDAQGPPPLVPTFTDVSYGSHPLETMDVYLSASANIQVPRPALIEIHAGGWAGGSKSIFAVYGGLIEKTYAHDISIISINYPLAPQDLFPAANYSCQRAIQFLRANAAAWSIDTNQLAVIGASSGAHLAMWVAMAKDAQDLNSTDPIKQYSSRVKACISYQGPSDLTDAYYFYDSSVGHGISPVYQFVGVQTDAQWFGLPPKKKNFLSPRWHVKNGAGAAANANVRFLGVYKGDPNVTSSSQLTIPSGDIHCLMQGLLMREELESIGAYENIVWKGSADFDPDPNIGLYASDLCADWLNIHLSDAKVRSIDTGNPGCASNQYMMVSGPAKIGTNNFGIHTYNGLPSGVAVVLVTDAILPQPVIIDPSGLSILVDLTTMSVAPIDMLYDSVGTGTSLVSIPNDTSLVGHVFYMQSLTPWFDSQGQYPYCVPATAGISSSAVLSLEIEN